ncbi:hypothetical protein TWF730_010456 [Orbilia blumenaviensis]|uniref:Nucleoside phosphorylase domain-containing protein n=1 Tax=Orbilia blumenaviensis TaxID=1796055 RepID=A0AAV9UQU1_9PEZI
MARPPIVRPKDRKGFQVGIICALPVSSTVLALFDEVWPNNGFENGNRRYGKATGDDNSYTFGLIGDCPVVLAYMPETGKTAASAVAAFFRISFRNIRLCLVVGICGGVPQGTPEMGEIFLGDIIISQGIVQYDYGRQFSEGFHRKDTMADNFARPSREIRGFLHKITERYCRENLRKNIAHYLENLCGTKGFEKCRHPGIEKDRLFKPGYRHKHHSDCVICAKCQQYNDEVCADALVMNCTDLRCGGDTQEEVIRSRLGRARNYIAGSGASESTGSSVLSIEEDPELQPNIHIGVMASGDSVIKSAYHRDKIAEKDRVIGFEMEAAGVWDTFPVIVVKGVCDYADSHSNREWQEYAAAAAAACMKALLNNWELSDMGETTDPEPLTQSLSCGVPTQSNENGINKYFEVPLGTNKNYVEREELSARLEAMFSSCQYERFERLRVAMCGLSGSGKTELAARFAEKHRKDYFAVFWVNAVNEFRLKIDFGKIAKSLGLDDDHLTNLASCAKRWLVDNSNWLLVIDNLNDDRIMDIVQETYLTAGMNGDILITSNKNLAGKRWKLLEVSGMQPHESKALVRNIAGLRLSEEQEILELLNGLGHLPIAVDQAASYMSATGIAISASEYGELFEDEKHNLL